MIIWVIPDLDFLELSLWLSDLKGGPVVAYSLTTTIGSVQKSELVLTIKGWLQVIDSDKVVVVAELFDGWEVFIRLEALKWQVRI